MDPVRNSPPKSPSGAHGAGVVSNGMEIRRLAKDDIPEFHALFGRVLEEMRDVFYPGELIDFYKEEDDTLKDLSRRVEEPRYIGIGAFQDGNLLGFAWGYDDGKKVFQLEWLAVAPEERGKGVGRTLTRALEDELAFQGFFKIFFGVSVKNIPAIKRCLHMGYKIEGVHPNHDLGWDFLSFGKIITPKRWTGPILAQPDFEIEDVREIYGGYGGNF